MVKCVAPVALVEERPATTWGLRSGPEKHSAAFAEASSCQGGLRSVQRWSSIWGRATVTNYNNHQVFFSGLDSFP
jgi:hypothetical protein